MIFKSQSILPVVLGYNHFKSTTELCLNAILPQAKKNALTVLAVDNGSNDDSAHLLKRYHLEEAIDFNFTLKINPVNLGYGGGMNDAVKNSDVDWFLLINSDVVFAPTALNELMKAANQAPSSVGLIHPITNNAGNAQGLYASSSTPESLFDEWSGMLDFPIHTLTPQQRSDFSCVLVRRNVWELLGGLDPVYGRGYYEDFDFSVRAKALGYESYICENSIVYHAGSASFSKDLAQANLIKNNKIIFKKRHPKIRLVHQRVDNYGVLLHYLKCLMHPLPESQLQAYRIRLAFRLKTAEQRLPRSFFKRLYWRIKLNCLITRACVFFPELKALWIR